MKQEKTVLMVVCFVVMSLIAGLIAGGGCARAPVEIESGEEPVYGGVLNLASTVDPIGFDDAINQHYHTSGLKYTNEDVWEGDWALGRAGGYGSGEADWFMAGGLMRLEHQAGALAERVEWDEQQKDTITLHLRQGVHWHDKPPVNGRELTADDVAFSINRHFTLPTGYATIYYPEAAATTQISAPDDWTVVIKCEPQWFGEVISLLDYMYIFPREAVETFGDMTNWRNSIGTGPFILTDYMPGSEMTFVRNPQHWRKNPVGPGEGDQLPYVDGVKISIIPDESTRIAAFRTGKIDITTMDWEQAEEFLRMPELRHTTYFEDYAQAVISMRTDKEDSPYADVRVRQALYLAIDNQKILDEYYGGIGTLLKWPIGPTKEYADAYVPLEELPASVQELYGYDPEKAKQLLADAGYPGGFKTSIICYNHRVYIDPLSMVKDMWAKVGVELTIEPKEYATFTGIIVNRAYDDMLYPFYSGIGTYFKAINYTGPGMYNASYVDDPVLNQARDEMTAAYPDEARVDQIHRELMPYLLEQAYVIQLPAPYGYRFWWPWVKNYSGEASVGFYNVGNYSKYAWIDQELKKSMGY